VEKREQPVEPVAPARRERPRDREREPLLELVDIIQGIAQADRAVLVDLAADKPESLDRRRVK